MHSINNLYSLSFQPFIFLFFVNAIEMRTHIIFLFKFWKFKREKLFESVELNRAGNDHIGWVHIFPRGEGATKLDLPITSSSLKKVVQISNGQYQMEHCQGDTCLLKIKTSSPLNPMFSLHTPQVVWSHITSNLQQGSWRLSDQMRAHCRVDPSNLTKPWISQSLIKCRHKAVVAAKN